MTDGQKPGVSLALGDLISTQMTDQQPAEAAGTTVEVRAEEPKPAKRTRREGGPAAPSPGGWAGPVPKNRISREPLNANVPAELDLLRRLRRYSADTGVDMQDFVAWAVHQALDEQGYRITRR